MADPVENEPAPTEKPPAAEQSVAKPVEAVAAPAPEPRPSVDVEKLRADFEREMAEKLEAARVEAAAQAVETERKRLEEEAKLAAMSEAERQAALLEQAEQARKEAEAKVRAAEKAAADEKARAAQIEANANRRLEFADRLTESGHALVLDDDVRKLAFQTIQGIAGDKPITAAMVAELREAKPWLFARGEQPAEPRSTSTGRGTSGSRAPERAPAGPSNVFNLKPDEWAAARRKAGFSS